MVYPTIHSAFIFPVRGHGVFRFDEVSIEAEPGMIVHGCPHRLLRFENLGSDTFEHINIYYLAGENSGNDPCDWMGRPFFFKPFDYDSILGRVERLADMGLQANYASLLDQIVGAGRLIPKLFSIAFNGAENGRMTKARQYLEGHFSEDISLADLAKVCEMSEQRVSYCFKREFGVAPSSFLIGLRLDRAAKLLESGALVKEAAAAVGYRDPLYFSRLFKRHYGYSPQSLGTKPQQDNHSTP